MLKVLMCLLFFFFFNLEKKKVKHDYSAMPAFQKEGINCQALRLTGQRFRGHSSLW